MSSSKTDIKKEKDLFKELDKLLLNQKETIINWLKTAKILDADYISFMDNKYKIITKSEYGKYNLILKWFIINKDKFIDDATLFDNIPSTTFTKISKMIMLETTNSSVKLDINEAIKKWKENPHKNPYNDSDVKVSIVPTSEYAKLYKEFCDYLSSNLEKPILPIIFEKEIRNKLPDNHIYAFKDIDYIENLKSYYRDEEWLNFLDAKKDVFYKNEKVNNVTGSTVYDFLFMHFFLKKNQRI